ncbi:MAG: S8 family peptidase [Bacteroidia bacterium]|nr:S8 family peptidase [Bacteroidia bacterium]
MRNIIYFLSFFVCLSAYSQKNVSNSLKSRIYLNDFPSQNFNVLIQGDIQKLIAAEKTLGIKVKYHAGNIASVNVNVASITALIESKIATFIEYIEPRKKTMNDSMLFRNRIKPVKLGTSPLTAAYDGTGIIVGIIDTGIDFEHPDFKDAFGNTRISYIWDQTVSSPTNIPTPFGYGQEWTAAQITASLCTHSDMPNYGHGTHVSGIATGNGLATGTHEGVAPRAEIIVVALSFGMPGPTIADAVQYIINKATAAGKPFVINASVGDYYGSHDGTDTEAKLIDAQISNIPGRAMVAAAGNGGNIKFHTQNNVIPADTNFTWITNGNSTLHYWMYADTANIKNVKYSVGVNRSTFEDLGRITFKNYNYGFTTKTDTLKYNNNRIGLVRSSASINSYGVYELYLRITADSLNYLWRVESNGTGKFDAWNFDFVSTALPTSTVYPKIAKYTMPDTVQSMVSSFQCSDEIITVANYVNKKSYYDVTNTLQVTPETGGQLAISSSAGPTRDNRQKPEVAASGACIFSAMALGMQAGLISAAPAAVAQGSFHVIGGGTSAASPVVTGLAALFLQAFPTYNNKQIRQAIINCTYSDGWTGTLPNYKFGYGKLDGFSTFTCALASTGIDNHNLVSDATIYPNPFNQEIKIKLKGNIKGNLKVFNAIGELIFEDKINSDEYILNRKLMRAAGVYFVNIKSDNYEDNFKIIAVD